MKVETFYRVEIEGKMYTPNLYQAYTFGVHISNWDYTEQHYTKLENLQQMYHVDGIYSYRPDSDELFWDEYDEYKQYGYFLMTKNFWDCDELSFSGSGWLLSTNKKLYVTGIQKNELGVKVGETSYIFRSHGFIDRMSKRRPEMRSWFLQQLKRVDLSVKVMPSHRKTVESIVQSQIVENRKWLHLVSE